MRGATIDDAARTFSCWRVQEVRRDIPVGDIERHAFGEAGGSADHVRKRRHSVKASDIVRLGKINGFDYVDTEVNLGAVSVALGGSPKSSR